MARLLNATGYFSSILAAVCLCLAVLAAPIGEARADTDTSRYLATCPAKLNDTCATANTRGMCSASACTNADPAGVCNCRWTITGANPETDGNCKCP